MNSIMYEIELKAHVSDKDSVRSRLEGIASFRCRIQKEDRYFRRTEGGRHLPHVRLRTEREFAADGAEFSERHVLTYKKKESRGGTEVNEELESAIESPRALEEFLLDSGHELYLQKRKDSLFFEKELSLGGCHLELVEVTPLGCFLEIEILCGTNDAGTVAAAQAELYRLLHAAGLDDSAVEPRYYSEMLAGEGC